MKLYFYNVTARGVLSLYLNVNMKNLCLTNIYTLSICTLKSISVKFCMHVHMHAHVYTYLYTVYNYICIYVHMFTI